MFKNMNTISSLSLSETLLIHLCLLLLISFQATEGNKELGPHPGWSYDNQNEWAQMYPACMGKRLRQSPIDINTDSVIFKPEYKLELIDYDQDVEFQLKNTHHSVSAIPIAAVTPKLRLNWLNDDDLEFELQEIHFHWGDGHHKGSEHEINDQRAAAEMHMVHYRKGINKTDIGNIENSVVVMGVFIESDSMEHTTLESLVEEVSKVNGTDTGCVTESSRHLINMLPSQHTFFTYNGSLTTPPCYEVVTWIIMSQPVFMSNEKLIELSNIETTDESKGRFKIKANYRDIQPLLDRPVYASFSMDDLISQKNPELSRNKNGGRFKAAFHGLWRRIETIKTSVKSSLFSRGRKTNDSEASN